MSSHPKIEDELPKTAEMKQREKHELQVLLESISLKSQESAQEERNSRVMHTYYSHLSRLYASSYVGFFTLLLGFLAFGWYWFLHTGLHIIIWNAVWPHLLRILWP